ncbi:hypothetical protein ACPA9J_22825 [Pseudomonas aeruginosa]
MSLCSSRRPRAGLAQRVQLDHQPVRQVLQALPVSRSTIRR